MDRSALIRVVLPMLAILLNGCIPLSDHTLDVPFHPQPSPNLCGVNCLAMAFDYFAVPYAFDDLTSKAFVPALEGSTPELLADVAETYGLHAEIKKLDGVASKAAIESGLLPIVFIPPADGEHIGHFILVTGSGENHRYIQAHDGKRRHCRRQLEHDTYVTLLLTITGKATR